MATSGICLCLLLNWTGRWRGMLHDENMVLPVNICTGSQFDRTRSLSGGHRESLVGVLNLHRCANRFASIDWFRVNSRVRIIFRFSTPLSGLKCNHRTWFPVRKILIKLYQIPSKSLELANNSELERVPLVDFSCYGSTRNRFPITYLSTISHRMALFRRQIVSILSHMGLLYRMHDFRHKRILVPCSYWWNVCFHFARLICSYFHSQYNEWMKNNTLPRHQPKNEDDPLGHWQTI